MLIKHQKILENVQRIATRLVSGIKNLSYYERFKELNISSLEYRRKRGTLIEMYKICYGSYDRNATAGLFVRNDRDSRGNACKVVVRKANCNIRLLQSHMRLKKNRPYNHWLKSQGHYLLCFCTSNQSEPIRFACDMRLRPVTA